MKTCRITNYFCREDHAAHTVVHHNHKRHGAEERYFWAKQVRKSICKTVLSRLFYTNPDENYKNDHKTENKTVRQ